MENIWTLLFNTSAIKALSDYRQCRNSDILSHNHSEASKPKRVFGIEESLAAV